MIAFLDGILAAGGTSAIVSIGGGIGLDVQLSAMSADRLPAVGQPIKLWTHLSVREDNWSLFGFIDAEERAMFRLLISVTGVGPKVAMGMLSKASGNEIARALRAGDEKALVRLPGIGKKSAARLIVELGQKVPESVLGGTSITGEADTAPSGLSEAMEVLQAMGLPLAAAEQALMKARQRKPEVVDDLELWVRSALRGI